MPDKESSPTIPEPHQAQEDEKPARKKKFFRRRRVWALILLTILCLVINGPLSRWIITYGLNKGLEGQGMTGSSKISGTLSQGFTIHSLSYSGTAGIQLLEIKELSANYKFTEIISGKIENLAITKAKVVIDLDKFPKTTKKKKKSNTQLKETLTKLHGWISQPGIVITDLDVSILKSANQQAHFLWSELHHQAGSNEFTITQFTATDRENRTTPIQDIQILWEPEAVTIDRFEILPDIAVEDVALDWSKDLHGQGELQFLDLYLQITAEHTLTAKLTKGSLDAQALDQRFGLTLPVDFNLTDIDVTIEEWNQPIPLWKIDAHLKASSATYKDYHLGNTDIQITQEAQAYEIAIKSDLNTNAVDIKSKGTWLDPNAKQWWSHTSASYDIQIPQLGTLTELIKGLPEKIQLNSTSVTAKGDIELKDNDLTNATLESRLSGMIANQIALPELNIEASYQNDGQAHAKITSSRDDSPDLHFDAAYHTKSHDYQGSVALNTDSPDWINAIAGVFQEKASLEGPVKISWSGQGNAKDFTDPNIQQTGKLDINQLSIKLPNKPTLEIATAMNYQWPDAINLSTFSLREGSWLGTASLAWDSKEINISDIRIQKEDKELASVHGSIPYHTEIKDSRQFFEQQNSWYLALNAQPIALKKLHEWFQIKGLSEITGVTDFGIEISGSPKSPQIKGHAKVSDVVVLEQNDLQPIQTAIDFYSSDKKLNLNGELLEGGTKRISIKGSIPFTPSTWINDPNLTETLIKKTPLSAEVNFNTFPLERLQKYIPQCESIEGNLNGNAIISGTIEKPLYQVNLDADISTLKLAESKVGTIRDVKVNSSFSENKQLNTKITAQINGGKFEAGGTVDLTEIKDPSFDLYLRTQYALIHRDDLMSVRANSNLRLSGKQAEATISGTVGIAESIFFKDIDLIPIGVPSSAVSKVNLPALSATGADNGLPIPEPFANWKLNLTLLTDDPFLIRGNIATGNLTGSLKVGGTLAKPAPQGTITINNVQAKLPFSTLKIAKGEVNFSPENGLNPTLNIRGKSTVGNHDVSLFVYGPASAPKTSFTSFPPLPETDVISLIATGTTTSGLEDRSVATFKAFQIFLLKLQQRNNKPDGNKLFKVLLSGIDDLNLNVGETDPFTGRRFTSATVNIHRNWNLTAQVDDTQQTRGLVVYVFRFR